MSIKTHAQCSVCKMQKIKKSFFTRFALSLYSAQISKNTKIPSIPIIHEGKNGKMQKVGQPEVKRGQKSQMREAIFAQGAKFSHPTQFS